MAVILKLPERAPDKFGHQRVGRRRKKKKHDADQADLFQASARIVSLPTKLSPFEQALLLDQQGSLRSRELYRHAIAENDCVPDAWCNLGILESNDGKLEEALKCFSRALQLEPSHFEAHFNLGNLYFDLGEFRPAQVHYEIARGIDESYPHTYFNLALVQALREELELAFESLLQFQQLAGKPLANVADQLLEQLSKTVKEHEVR